MIGPPEGVRTGAGSGLLIRDVRLFTFGRSVVCAHPLRKAARRRASLGHERSSGPGAVLLGVDFALGTPASNGRGVLDPLKRCRVHREE
jgi:hypothetical protein